MNTSSTGRLVANLACLATASTLHAQTRIIYVDDDAAPGGDGTSWSQAFRDLSQALEQATGVAHQIEFHVAQGVYTPDLQGVDRHKSFTIHSNSLASAMILSVPGGLSLLGGFRGVTGGNPEERDPSRFVTVLSGDLQHNDGPNFANRTDNSDQILDVVSRDPVTVDGFTIRGANTAEGVAPIRLGSVSELWSDQRTPVITFSRCQITDNTGGEAILFAVKEWAGSEINLRIADCTFFANRCIDRGFDSDIGTLAVGTLVTADVVRSRFIANQGVYGPGGVTNYGEHSMRIEDCVFAGNSTTAGDASAMQLWPDGNVVTRCTIVDNRAFNTWGVAVRTARNIFTDCIFRPYPGESVQKQLKFINCCGKFVLEHCAIAGGISAFANNPSSVSYLGGNIDADPQFVDIDGTDNNLDTWGDNDLRLGGMSPCIDAGRPIGSIAGLTDAAGFPRFFDGNFDGNSRLDMGAFEFFVAPCVADIDLSGFVDTEDFDAFVRAFEAGC